MTLLTLFTAPKPFVDEHTATIQYNALRSWQALGPDVEVLVIGQEDGLAEAAAEIGMRHLPNVARTPGGTPLVSSIFDLAHQHGVGQLFAYVNADILLFDDLLAAARRLAATGKPFLAVGQRYDLDQRTRLSFAPGWQADLLADVRQRGRLHPRGGSDYFLYPQGCFNAVPAFAIGRAGWDNWMIYHARRQGYAVVDATADVLIIHQDHDYRHLPGGQPHYRHPETYENVRLAGGDLTIFRLDDSSHILQNGELARPAWSWRRFWREVEIWPLITLGSSRLAAFFNAVFHPIKAYQALRRRLRGSGADR